MPWKSGDAKGHTKSADTPAKQKRWATVANSALQNCLDDDGEMETCEASAIKQANSVIAEWEPDENVTENNTTDTVIGDEETQPVRDLEEVGKRLNRAEVKRLQGALQVIQDTLSWANYEDMEEGGLEATANKVRNAFNQAHQRQPGTMMDSGLWAQEVFEDDDKFGDAVIVRDGGRDWAVPYHMVDGEIVFEDRSKWRKVGQYWDYEEMEEGMTEFAESGSGRAMRLVEVDQAEVVPLHLEVALIEPGFGNKRDNHYYPKDVLKRDAKVFEGVKMYESDHGPKSTRLWVSTVKEIKGFTESGAPIGLVSVCDPGFATRIMALEADDLLDKMECSIFANGKARKGKVEGRKTKIVEGITEASAVDWVTRGGAGGRVLSLSELEEENMSEEPEGTDLDEGKKKAEDADFNEGDEDPQEDFLEISEVKEALGRTNLPDASKARLSEADYQSEDDLSDAIKAEVVYVKELTGSGKPFGQGTSEPGEKSRKEILKEKDERFGEIMRTVGLEV